MKNSETKKYTKPGKLLNKISNNKTNRKNRGRKLAHHQNKDSSLGTRLAPSPCPWLCLDGLGAHQETFTTALAF